MSQCVRLHDMPWISKTGGEPSPVSSYASATFPSSNSICPFSQVSPLCREQIGVAAPQPLEVRLPHLRQIVLAVHVLAGDDLGFEDLGPAGRLALEVVAGAGFSRVIASMVAFSSESEAMIAPWFFIRTTRLSPSASTTATCDFTPSSKYVACSSWNSTETTLYMPTVAPSWTTAPRRSASAGARCAVDVRSLR